MRVKLETTIYKGITKPNWILFESRVFEKKLDIMMDANLTIIDLNTLKPIEEYVDDVWDYEWEAIN